MIPELTPSELDPDNNIPEDLTAIIVAAIQTFEQQRKESLIKGASKNYLKGIIEAYKQVNKKYTVSEFKDEVQEFLKVYEKQLQDGYTIIQGKKIYWLRDRTQAERQYLFNTISAGINKGDGPADIAKDLKKYFDLSKSHAELIARTETAYIQGNARENSYKNLGVKKVKWLLGPNPCSDCQILGNKVFLLDEIPYHIPKHPRCTCAIRPILDEDNTPVTKASDLPKAKPGIKEPIEKPIKETTKTPNEVENIIREKEHALLNRTTEKGIMFDKNGKILLEKEGDAESVAFTKAERKLMKGNILTHNHPGIGVAFSDADLGMACAYNLNEMRATGKAGTHIIKMADGSNFNEDIYINKIQVSYTKHRKIEFANHNRRMREMEAGTRRVKITEDESFLAASRKIWIDVVKDVPELNYELIKWD